MTATSQSLESQVKELLVRSLMLPCEPESIEDTLLLFSPKGLFLDSVDALQLMIALEKEFGLKVSDVEAEKGLIATVQAIANAIRKRRNL